MSGYTHDKRKTPTARPDETSFAPAEQSRQSMSNAAVLQASHASAPQRMSSALRERFEPGFGANFENIRISRGYIPPELGIQAVARGTDILLDRSADNAVLGHELAHVVQQASGRVGGGYPVVNSPTLEHEADVQGRTVANGGMLEGGMSMGPGLSEFGSPQTLMPIAPMSGATAPAQCKKKEDKKNKQNPREIEMTQTPEPDQTNASATPQEAAQEDILQVATVSGEGETEAPKPGILSRIGGAFSTMGHGIANIARATGIATGAKAVGRGIAAGAKYVGSGIAAGASKVWNGAMNKLTKPTQAITGWADRRSGEAAGKPHEHKDGWVHNMMGWLNKPAESTAGKIGKGILKYNPITYALRGGAWVGTKAKRKTAEVISKLKRQNQRAADDFIDHRADYDKMSKKDRFLWCLKNPIARVTAARQQKGHDKRKARKESLAQLAAQYRSSGLKGSQRAEAYARSGVEAPVQTTDDAATGQTTTGGEKQAKEIEQQVQQMDAGSLEQSDESQTTSTANGTTPAKTQTAPGAAPLFGDKARNAGAGGQDAGEGNDHMKLLRDTILPTVVGTGGNAAFGLGAGNVDQHYQVDTFNNWVGGMSSSDQDRLQDYLKANPNITSVGQKELTDAGVTGTSLGENKSIGRGQRMTASGRAMGGIASGLNLVGSGVGMVSSMMNAHASDKLGDRWGTAANVFRGFGQASTFGRSALELGQYINPDFGVASDLVPGMGAMDVGGALSVGTNVMNTIGDTIDAVGAGRRRRHLGNRKEALEKRQTEAAAGNGTFSEDDTQMLRIAGQGHRTAKADHIQYSTAAAGNAVKAIGNTLKFTGVFAPAGMIGTALGTGMNMIGSIAAGSERKEMSKQVVNEELQLDEKISAVKDYAVQQGIDPALTDREAKHVALMAMGFPSGKRKEATQYYTAKRVDYLLEKAEQGDDQATGMLDDMGLAKKDGKYVREGVGLRLGMNGPGTLEQQRQATIDSRDNPFKRKLPKPA